MKKKVLKSCSLLVLALVFGVVSTQAQNLGSYHAEIPFDFMIGGTAYDAGDYKISLRSPNNLATVLTIKQEKDGDLNVTAVMRNGNTSKKNKASLVFNRYGDHYVLKQLVTPRFGFTAPKAKKAEIDVWMERNPKVKPDTVSILLKR